jgi:hypothetical protein
MSRLPGDARGLENGGSLMHIWGMGDDGGFVVLVHITVGGGLSPYRDVYLVGCATHEEAEARVRDLYPTEPNLALYVSPLSVGDTKGLKLARNEVRSWHDDPPQTP